MTTIEELVSLDLNTLKREVDELRAIQEWALNNLGIDYKAGDRVQIVSERPSQSKDGWKPYREALAVGRTGVAGELHFNQHRKRWDVLVRMDRGWSVHEQGAYRAPETVRYWWGPFAETPAGYVPPSSYDRERWPEGETRSFAMPVSWVRKADAANPEVETK